jgi:hypothetical protein
MPDRVSAWMTRKAVRFATDFAMNAAHALRCARCCISPRQAADVDGQYSTLSLQGPPIGLQRVAIGFLGSICNQVVSS